MALQKGDIAPDFTLKNTDGKEVSLSSYKGNKNVVILFFPLAFTGVCTKELCATRDDIGSYNNLDAEVLAISVDSFFSLKQFKERDGYNFELLSDFNKDVSASYGALYEDFLGYKGVSKRSAFVVNKEGKIEYAEVLESAGDLPNFDAVKASLA